MQRPPLARLARHIWRGLPRCLLGPALAYAALGAGLWAVPLVGTLHVEGAAVVAAAACLVSAAWGAGQLRRGREAAAVLAAAAALSLIPVALLGVSALWRANCGWAQGLGLALQFVPAAAAFGVGLAAAMVGLGVRWAGTAAVLAAVLVGLGGAAFDLGLHPQVYTYSHVFGGVLGPIYDERLAVRPGLLAFRGLTLLWTGALVALGAWAASRRRKLGRRGEKGDAAPATGGWAVLGLLAALALAYAFAPELGFTTPERVLRAELSRHVARPALDLYADPSTTTPGEAERLADLAVYRLGAVEQRLGARASQRVQLYVYSSADQKARLVGARETSVAPVWLPTPQVHLLRDRAERSLAHEMAHAVSREFGLPGLHATLAVGLVEGLAVAVEPPDGLPHPHDLVAAAARYQDAAAATTNADPTDIGARYADGLAEAVGASLSPLGFWGGRGAVSYTTAGSFVAFLLERYGPDPLRAAYARADFQGAYGKPAAALAEEWAAFIDTREPSAVATAVVERQFSRPSLFEQRCPHHEPRAARLLRAASAAEPSDRAAAERLALAAVSADSADSRALTAWASLRLATADSAEAVRLARRLAPRAAADSSDALRWSRLGDARAVARDPAADEAYARALALQPPYALGTSALLGAKRALAGDPDLIGAWLSPDAARAAQILGEADAPAASLLAALRSADDDPGEAARWAERAAHNWPDDAQAAQLLLWAAAWSEADGDFSAAHRLTRDARARAGQAGRGELAAFAASESERYRSADQ